MNLRGRDARAVNAFFNSVELTYDSIWTLEREDDYRKACEFNFRLPFTTSRMSDEEREAYKGMFIKELIRRKGLDGNPTGKQIRSVAFVHKRMKNRSATSDRA